MANKCILIIDDETDIHTVAQIGLTLETGWTVLTASSGIEGVEIAHKQHPDAILLDAMMPQQGGTETLEILQSSPETKDIPVIFFTAKTQATHRREFYRLGAKGVISKPFDPTTLASQVSGFLGWNE
ncbi:response regulator receiver protein [Leptolyngbya sp. Heron Island J]|uniref:response regulator n=1 Tax=Leptolyngbya sp. Heron Island J TaxID=1385935 RepID=UPI0003B9600F|nr:response regulator [Leptolyngbya sp. Heron Island J]ESA37447.1 response regulator receiver protein [Leptolyngbya sp. Heron Island J]